MSSINSNKCNRESCTRLQAVAILVAADAQTSAGASVRLQNDRCKIHFGPPLLPDKNFLVLCIVERCKREFNLQLRFPRCIIDFVRLNGNVTEHGTNLSITRDFDESAKA